MPITFTLPGGGYALVTEANLLNYTDLGVQVSADHSLRAYFHTPSDRNGWTTDDAVVQPWRVTLLARDLNALVNSDLVRNLCPAAPPELAKAKLDSARPFLVAMVVERRSGLFRAASMGGLDETTRLRVLPR